MNDIMWQNLKRSKPDSRNNNTPSQAQHANPTPVVTVPFQQPVPVPKAEPAIPLAYVPSPPYVHHVPTQAQEPVASLAKSLPSRPSNEYTEQSKTIVNLLKLLHEKTVIEKELLEKQAKVAEPVVAQAPAPVNESILTTLPAAEKPQVETAMQSEINNQVIPDRATVWARILMDHKEVKSGDKIGLRKFFKTYEQIEALEDKVFELAANEDDVSYITVASDIVGQIQEVFQDFTPQ